MTLPLNTDETDNPCQCRLAIRHEGGLVNAYLARSHTMDEAVHFACINADIVSVHPELYEKFKELCKQVMIRFLESEIGGNVTISHEEAAPENERGAH